MIIQSIGDQRPTVNPPVKIFNNFSTNTTNYMRDNNIGKKTDIVPSKEIIVVQSLVHIRKYDYPKTKRIPNRENVKRNGHSQPITETITA